MKPFLGINLTQALVIFAVCQVSFAGPETSIIAASDWSKPVSTSEGQTLRGRLLVTQEHSPAHAGPWPETALYLELQNVSGAIGDPMQLYFDPGHGLSCQILDANGKPPPPSPGFGSGGGAGACWVTLPYDATIRLRANMYGYGTKPGEGLLLALVPPGQHWTIQAGDMNVYYLSGTFTAPRSTKARNSEKAHSVWSGTLELPKAKIVIPKR